MGPRGGTAQMKKAWGKLWVWRPEGSQEREGGEAVVPFAGGTKQGRRGLSGEKCAGGPGTWAGERGDSRKSAVSKCEKSTRITVGGVPKEEPQTSTTTPWKERQVTEGRP